MKLMPSTLPLAGALAMFAAVAGCTQESNPGGPGVTKAPQPTTQPPAKTDGTAKQEQQVVTTQKPVVTDKANTFRLHTPLMETTLDSGKKRDIDISISRGTDFKQSVKLEFKPPTGVTVTPAMATIPAGQDKITVTLEATKAAPPGKGHVQVTAIPETGQSVSLEIPVEVKAAS
jgi:uncharacterized membrane protein